MGKNRDTYLQVPLGIQFFKNTVSDVSSATKVIWWSFVISWSEEIKNSCSMICTDSFSASVAFCGITACSFLPQQVTDVSVMDVIKFPQCGQIYSFSFFMLPPGRSFRFSSPESRFCISTAKMPDNCDQRYLRSTDTPLPFGYRFIAYMEFFRQLQLCHAIFFPQSADQLAHLYIIHPPHLLQ